MELAKFILLPLLVAIGAGLSGTLIVGAVEVIRAFLDPVRREAISHRNWRENLHHMLF